MPIKTLHITNNYHPSSGGIRTFYLALLDAANRLRRPMRLVVPGDTDHSEEVGEFGRIYHVRAPRTPVFDRRYRLILPHTFLFPRENGLREILRLEQPDVVEICDKYSLCYLAGVLRRQWIPGVRRPTLIGVSCERMDDNVESFITASATARRLSALYMKKIYGPLFDFHIGVSHYVGAELSSVWPGAEGRLFVLPMGVHAGHLGPEHRDSEWRARLQREVGGNGGTALLLYAGRFSPEKNLALLVSMMEKLTDCGHVSANHVPGRPIPDCRLLLAGSGPLEPWLRGQSVRSDGRIRLIGHVEGPAEMARLLASVDLVVHPNHREPFGIAPLEAMASGTPLLVPNAGGVLEYANEDCAWLAPPEPGSFASAVLEALSNPSATYAKAERALQVAARHDWRQVAVQFFETYEALHALRLRTSLAEPLDRSSAAVEALGNAEVCGVQHSSAILDRSVTP